MKHTLTFILNGLPAETLVGPTDTLLDVLRENLSITSVKRGCDTGNCGTCTVLLEGEPVRSCLTLALTVMGKQVTTVESLMQNGELHPLQKEFHARYASQCGFCTPGVLLVAKALLERNPHPTRAEIIDAISGNYCRCGAYLEIVNAIQAVASNGYVKEAV